MEVDFRHEEGLPLDGRLSFVDAALTVDDRFLVDTLKLLQILSLFFIHRFTISAYEEKRLLSLLGLYFFWLILFMLAIGSILEILVELGCDQLTHSSPDTLLERFIPTCGTLRIQCNHLVTASLQLYSFPCTVVIHHLYLIIVDRHLELFLRLTCGWVLARCMQIYGLQTEHPLEQLQLILEDQLLDTIVSHRM